MNMVANSNFKIDLCSEKDLGKLINFVRRLKSKNINLLPDRKNYFLNRYRRDNRQKLNLFLLKYKNNKIIGCGGYIPFKGLFNGKNIKGIICTDIIIDPNYSRQFPGLFALLYRSYKKFIFEDKLFLLTFPNDKWILDDFKCLGWRDFSVLYQLRNPLFERILPHLKSSVSFTTPAYFDKKINYFFKEVSAQHNFLTYADSDLLNQKYILNPYRKYLTLIASGNKEIFGYVVAERKKSEIYIVDLVVNLNSPQNILLLLGEVFKYFRNRRVSSISCFLSHKKYIDILKRAGFYFSQKKICLFFERFNDSQFFPAKGLHHLNGIGKEMF